MKHMFLGSNTAKGFVHYYNKVLTSQNNRLFILKGGSGVGKHTFMNNCANHFLKQNITVEYYHCSNDPGSLDGIKLVELGVALIDGTSPHRIDPVLPGCFDEIIDLGVFIDYKEMEKHKEEVLHLSNMKKQLYKRAYNLLETAGIIFNDSNELINNCAYKEKINKLISALPKALLNKKITKGEVFYGFASSYTAKGYENYLDTIIQGKKTIGIRGYKVLNQRIMEEIFKIAMAKELNMTVLKNPIDPSTIDHIIFEDFAIISIDSHSEFCEVDEIMDFKSLFNKDKILDYNEAIISNNNLFDTLVNETIKTMEKCNVSHKKLESLFIPNMDFKGVDKVFESTIEKINSYLKN